MNENIYAETYLVADHHFGHKNIITHEARPFEDTLQMDMYMRRQWNNTVPKDGIVIHLGDFTLGGCPKFLLDYLNGSVILVRGNHDHGTNRWLERQGFVQVVKHMYYKDILFIHNPNPKNYPNDYLNKGIKYVIHGHIHSKTADECEWWNENQEWIQKNNVKFINVGVERLNYTPIKLSEVLNLD